ncbi:hypothetical protein [Marmoricola sp. RAF53]
MLARDETSGGDPLRCGKSYAALVGVYRDGDEVTDDFRRTARAIVGLD